MDRRTAMTLEDERGHAVMAEEDRSRKTDKAAPHDQNGDLFVDHLRLRVLAYGRSAGRRPVRRAIVAHRRAACCVRRATSRSTSGRATDAQPEADAVRVVAYSANGSRESGSTSASLEATSETFAP